MKTSKCENPENARNKKIIKSGKVTDVIVIILLSLSLKGNSSECIFFTSGNFIGHF